LNFSRANLLLAALTILALGWFKKHALSLPEGSVQQGRSYERKKRKGKSEKEKVKRNRKRGQLHK
jgi:hypothetical protein